MNYELKEKTADLNICCFLVQILVIYGLAFEHGFDEPNALAIVGTFIFHQSNQFKFAFFVGFIADVNGKFFQSFLIFEGDFECFFNTIIFAFEFFDCGNLKIIY